LGQLPEKERNLVQRLGLKPAALRSRLNYYQNQKETYASARKLLGKETEDAGLKIVLNILGLSLGKIVSDNYEKNY
jgi:hypothetical protein